MRSLIQAFALNWYSESSLQFIYLFKFYDINTYIWQKQIYINAKGLDVGSLQ